MQLRILRWKCSLCIRQAQVEGDILLAGIRNLSALGSRVKATSALLDPSIQWEWDSWYIWQGKLEY